MKHLLGAHMSIAGGLELALQRGEEIGCTAMQIFTANASRWHAKPITQEAAGKFRERWEESSIGPVFSHDSYLINLASQDKRLWEKSKHAFLEELQRCDMLGIPGVVMHPGAHLGAGEDAGLDRVRSAFTEFLAEAPASVMILVENTAAQGTCLGGPFRHISTLLEGFPHERFGVCFDTCHACAAGYDLATQEGYATAMEEFDTLVGLERIKLFHVNDSKKECGSHVDRHAHIGEGAIGLEGFRNLMQDERLVNIPKILETPKGEDGAMDRQNLAILRELAGEPQ
jgi:deoxyribonuclease-4